MKESQQLFALLAAVFAIGLAELFAAGIIHCLAGEPQFLRRAGKFIS